MDLNEIIYSINGFDITVGHLIVGLIGLGLTGFMKTIKFQAKAIGTFCLVAFVLYTIITNVAQT